MITKRWTATGLLTIAMLLALGLAPSQQETQAYTSTDDSAYNAATTAYYTCLSALDAYESNWAYQAWVDSYYGWYWCYYGAAYSNLGYFHTSVLCYFYAIYYYELAQVDCYNSLIDELSGFNDEEARNAYVACADALSACWYGVNQYLPYL